MSYARKENIKMAEENKLGQRLSELRIKAGLSQEELGEVLGVTSQDIASWEDGSSEPTLSNIKKMATVFGVSVVDIVDPENAPEIRPEIEVKYDLYLTGDFLKNRNRVVDHIRNKFRIKSSEAHYITKSYPHALTGNVSEKEAEILEAYFDEIGVKLERKLSQGQIPYRPMITEEELKKKLSVAEQDKKYMKRRFITANITAAIPALVAMIMLMINRPMLFENIGVDIYAGICIYSTLFLLWYPSIIRNIIGGIMEYGATEDTGGLVVIPKILTIILFFAFTVVISPLLYLMSIGIRIKRMKTGDMRDNIFD